QCRLGFLGEQQAAQAAGGIAQRGGNSVHAVQPDRAVRGVRAAAVLLLLLLRAGAILAVRLGARAVALRLAVAVLVRRRAAELRGGGAVLAGAVADLRIVAAGAEFAALRARTALVRVALALVAAALAVRPVLALLAACRPGAAFLPAAEGPVAGPAAALSGSLAARLATAMLAAWAAVAEWARATVAVLVAVAGRSAGAALAIV